MNSGWQERRKKTANLLIIRESLRKSVPLAWNLWQTDVAVVGGIAFGVSFGFALGQQLEAGSQCCILLKTFRK